MKIICDFEDNWCIEGLTYEHLEVLDAVMRNVRLGTKGYEKKAFELVNMFNNEGGSVDVRAIITYNDEVVLV